MAYVQQIRRRGAAERAVDQEDLVARDPQRASNTRRQSSATPTETEAPEESFTNIVSVVFVTASQTFTGDVAGYTTLTGEASPTKGQSSVQASQQNTQQYSENSYTAPSSTQQEQTSYYSPTEATVAVTSAAASNTDVESISATDLGALTVASSTLLSSYVPYSRTATRSYSSMSATSTAESSEKEAPTGMSTGGKAGLAIGILLIIGLIAGGALFFFWKKKKDNKGQQSLDDEKVGGYSGPIAAMAAKSQATKSGEKDSNAPRLSLRPVTQFIPSLANAQKRLSNNPLNKTNKPTGMAAADPPANPFGDQNRSGPPPPSVTVTPPASEVGSSAAAGIAAGAVGAAAVAGVAAKGAHGQPRAAPPGPGGPQPNVHRVQLDFKPSMDDEIELRAGQLIRVLHEYDDGWALCVRLDKSHQGVAPRTCLSARPVKPRPANGSPRLGPNGRPMSPAQSRPMTPNGGQSRPMTPGSRPMSPAGGPSQRPQSPAGSRGPSRPGTSQSNRAASPPSHAQQPMPQGSNQPGQFNQAPRPLSPGPVPRSPVTAAPKRSQSPGPYGAQSGPAPMSSEQRRRSNSAGGPLRGNRGSPPNSSPLARGDPMAGWRPPRPGQGY